MALTMLQNADALGKWASEAETGIGNARTELQGWKSTLDKTNTKVKLQADIADLESKLATAQKELRDPGLTKERKAQLKATITDLEQKIRTAKGTTNLGSPSLTATKIAKLTATKTELEQKIAAAKKDLNAPGLTATKKAKLTATITDLQRQVNAAQAKINSLRGKTVSVTMNTYKNLIETKIPGGVGVKFPARAAGGPVAKGQPYIVGEKRPELFVPGEDGQILPSVPKAAQAGVMSQGGGSPQPLVVQLMLDGRVIQQSLLKLKRNNGGLELGLV
jgi:predicted  nucleic acid-binding Zn-ribbon protein